MNATEYDAVSAELAQEAEGIQTSKRPGYTGGSVDVLANFKKVAERVDTVCPHCNQSHKLTAANVWAVYFLKHIDAILSIMNRPDLPVSEAALGRFSDARNYGTLGYAIQQERDAEKPTLHDWGPLVPTFVPMLPAPTTPPTALMDWQPTNRLGATRCDPAQTAVLGVYRQRALESAQALDRQNMLTPYQPPPLPGLFEREVLSSEALEASADPSALEKAGASGKVVLFHAPPRDTPDPNTEL